MVSLFCEIREMVSRFLKIHADSCIKWQPSVKWDKIVANLAFVSRSGHTSVTLLQDTPRKRIYAITCRVVVKETVQYYTVKERIGKEGKSP